MTVIIGGRESILSQVPQELRTKHPRLSKTLESQECQEMVEQSLAILSDETMAGSHQLFCDIVRLVLALQLSVAESSFGKEQELPKTPGLNIII